MKSTFIFILFLIVGFFSTFFLINKKTIQEVSKPKVKISNEASKFSLEKAPSITLHGDITLLTGDVKWQSRIATEASTITFKQQVQQGESLETGKTGKVSLAFPNMLFTLSPNSKLNIVQTLPTSIVLEQQTGEIMYQTTSSTLLGVRVSPLLIESQGGEFSITIDEDDGTVKVSVKDGFVTVAYNDSNTISTVEKIEKEQVMTFDPSSRTSTIK